MIGTYLCSFSESSKNVLPKLAAYDIFLTLLGQKVKKYDFKTKFIHIDFTYGLSKKIEDVTHYYVMSNNGKKYIHNFEIIEYNMDKITDY